jgi:hypothetical protein
MINNTRSIDMLDKIIDIHYNILVLCGFYYSLRFIITKEIYIHDIFGNTINTIYLLIQTIVLIAIYNVYRAKNEEISEEIISK